MIPRGWRHPARSDQSDVNLGEMTNCLLLFVGLDDSFKGILPFSVFPLFTRQKYSFFLCREKHKKSFSSCPNDSFFLFSLISSSPCPSIQTNTQHNEHCRDIPRLHRNHPGHITCLRGMSPWPLASHLPSSAGEGASHRPVRHRIRL